MNTIEFDSAYYELPDRDTQVSKVYAAERATKHFRKDKIGDRSAADVQAFLNHVAESNCWRTCCDLAGRSLLDYEPPELLHDEWGGHASADRGQMLMSRGASYKSVLLHEMAHAVWPTWLDMDYVGHHWPFLRIYLRLVRRFMGTDPAADLRFQLQAHRAKLSPKRKSRELTAERYAVLRGQVDKMNAAKRSKQ